jgi:2-phospho-L-lactate guanylyltransferase
MTPDSMLTWSLVVPVKVLARAKSRLVALADEDRAALALAMAVDTVTEAVACASVGVVIVVSDDPVVGAELAAIGAVVIPDQPGAGLNSALVFGADHAATRWPGRGLAALTADLPAMAAAELATALAASSAVTHAFVADAAGTGTTLYTAGPGAPFRPRFGPQSRERHRQGGAVELDVPAASGLRRDVDTLEDLHSAADIRLGPRTTRLLVRSA